MFDIPMMDINAMRNMGRQPKFKFDKNWLIFAIAILVTIFIFSKVFAMETHFKLKEFSCKHCGKVAIDNRLINKLEQLRTILNNRPIVITSGYRCPIHNKRVGGVKYSQHLQGKAVDIKVKGISPAEVARLAKNIGFTWTKTYSSWTHIDLRQKGR